MDCTAIGGWFIGMFLSRVRHFPMFIFFIPSMAVAQQDTPAISLTPLVSYESFNNEVGLGSSIAYGAAVSYTLNREMGIELSLLTSRTTEEFDLIATRGTLDVRRNVYQVQFHYLLLSLENLFETSSTAGVGLFHLSTDAQLVSLGALGQVVVPGRSETRSLVSLGIEFSKRLTSRVSVQVHPKAVFFTPLSPLQANYFLSGGIRVGIL